MSRVYYLGKVYCLTVPTGAYVVRRHGKMLICGNSAAWYNKCDVGIVLHRPGATTSMEVSVAKIRYEETGTMGSTHLRWIEDWQKYMGGE